MKNPTHLRRQRRQRARRRADLAAAYAILAEAAPFFDTALGAGLAGAIEAGIQPDAWAERATDVRGSNGSGAGRTLSSAPRPYEGTV